ncbi:type 2 isopentenyl-diphosphate Delta-isomerase [Alicyclobacillus sp. SO9]|uniref:type 2 isopentenyl-diphosphate Delta-isomerase n=1 Tax=Alicyclobacillus sp. SO9 TaxID=2665646 RepID=UPI0018E76FFE|nr:type 2 isopentenyl-diphosphate Delta-isomerase [Alicyclobacillus sp. SO9]QQE79884.1 type 2 isopentenyl-diphosphate Delta-isomerase [Alicyclobacillus sp. SO9]
MDFSTSKRKEEHIDIVLNKEVTGRGIKTGFDDYRFEHQSLPEIRFDEISLASQFLSKKMQTPFLISSMVGGTDRAKNINKTLASVAERRGWAMALGSVRSAIERPDTSDTYEVRRYAPSIPILANIGAVQLNYGYGVEECKRAVELTQADGLILHMNSLQEVFQPEGNTDFKGLLSQIETLCTELSVPVGVKDVGFGVTGLLAEELFQRGVSFVDVAGAGGTSWIQVEKYRNPDEVKKAAAEVFQGWGNPTANCIVDVVSRPSAGTVIASGGLSNGLDAAKALALGANLAGFGRSILAAAVESEERLNQLFEGIELQCRIAMFGIGVPTIDALRHTTRLHRM